MKKISYLLVILTIMLCNTFFLYGCTNNKSPEIIATETTVQTSTTPTETEATTAKPSEKITKSKAEDIALKDAGFNLENATVQTIEKDIEDGKEVYKDGHPWDTSLYAVSQGYSLMDEEWTRNEPFCNNVVFSEIERVAAQTDEWLLSLGYKREGANYRVVGDNTDRTIALFSHGGSSSALFSHVLNLPFFYLCRAICPDFTSITVLSLSDEKGTLTTPMIELANDSRHIRSGGVSYEM